MKIRKHLILRCQLLIVWYIRRFVLSKYELTTDDTRLTDFNGPIMIVANHQRSLDPFIILAALPKDKMHRVLPVKFMTANIHYYRWSRPLNYLAGCFPAQPKGHNQNYGVNGAVKFYKQGFSQFIFPEGKRTKERIPAKYGVIKIIEQTESRNALLCNINWQKTESGKNKINVNYSVNSNINQQKSPDKLMDEIYKL